MCSWRRTRFRIPPEAVFLAIGVAACSGEVANDSRDWSVSAQSFGPIRFGVTLDETALVLNEHLELDAGERVTEGCDYLVPATLPPGTLLMVIDSSVVARVDVNSTGVRTQEDIGVGSTEAEVQRAYAGRIRLEPHAYEGPTGHYLVHLAPDTMFAIVFETDGQRVTTRYRAGRQPEVMFIEGCL